MTAVTADGLTVRTCPDCYEPVTLPLGAHGMVHCLSYLHADGTTQIAKTRAESLAIYRAILDASRVSALANFRAALATMYA